jgi:hypothetical protein
MFIKGFVMMRQYIVYLFVVFILNACASSQSSIHDGKNSFTITSNNNTVVIDTQGKESYKAGGCLEKGIYFEDDTFQVEYIKLRSNCTWTGLADGLYQDFLRKNFKGLKKNSSIKLDNGDIYRFNVGQEYFYLISLYSGTSNIFIIDYEGKIVSKLLEKELPVFAKNQLKSKLKKEFLENYQFKGYFESRRNDNEDIVLP